MALRFRSRPTGWRGIAFVLAGITLIAGSAAGWRSRSSHRAAPTAPSPTRPNESKSEAATSPGEATARLTLLLESEVTLRPFALAPPGRADRAPVEEHLHYRTTGVLRRMVLARSRAGSVELLAVEGATATAKALREERRPSVERALAQGVLVERTADDRVVRVRLPLGAERDGEDALRQLAELTQLAKVPAEAREIRVDESAVAGALAARYEEHTTGDRREAVRRVVLLRDAETSGPEGLETKLEGEFHAELGANGGLLALRGQQSESKVHRRTGAVFMNAMTRLALTRLAGEEVPAPVPSEGAFGEWISLEGRLPAKAATELDALAAIVESRTLRDILGLYANASTDGDARAQLDRTLWAFLRLHPEACAEIATRVANASLGDGAAQVALSALFRAGHGAAQAALADVVRRWRTSPDATSVVAMFGSLPEVTPESESFLRSLRDDGNGTTELASNAGLALASAGSRLRERAPARAAALADEYEQRVTSADSPLALAQALAALGNVESERIAELAAPQLDHDDPLVRRMAVHALGVAHDDATKQHVARLAETDPDPMVREEAKSVLAAPGT